MKFKIAQFLDQIWAKAMLASTLGIALFSNGHAAIASSCFDRTNCFEVGADWLYWKVFQDNMEYAAQITFTPTPFSTVASKPLGPDFRANSGFRVFANYIYGNDLWQISGIFSRLLSTAHRDIPASSSFVVLNAAGFPIFTALDNAQFFSLNSTWDFQINYFDLDVNHAFKISPRFVLTPHMGLRGMWIRQKLHIDAIPVVGVAFFSELSEKYDGYGIESGLFADLELGCGFALSGHFGGSLLYAKLTLDEGFTDVGILAVHADKSDFRLNPTIDGFIGLQYLGRYCSHAVRLHIGWEQHVVMNVNNLSFSYSDLTLQGLTLGGSIGF